MTNLEVFNQANARFTGEKALKVLKAPLDKTWIETRKVGNTELSYIGGHVVIRLLNEAFNYQWNFEIVSEEIVQSIPKYNKWAKNGADPYEAQPPVVKVLGRLTVPGLGIKEQYGSKVLIGGASEQESAFKSAATDAMKKCASLFGIGLDLYGVVEGFEMFQEVEGTPYQEVTPAPAVLDPATMTKASEVAQPTPAPAPAPQPVQEPAPTPQPQGGATVLQPSEPQQTQGAQTAPATPASAPAPSTVWEPAQVNALIAHKKALGITDNEQLNPYVREFLNSGDVSYQNITPQNIEAFNVFLAGKQE